jgi:hypothetical protein
MAFFIGPNYTRYLLPQQVRYANNPRGTMYRIVTASCAGSISLRPSTGVTALAGHTVYSAKVPSRQSACSSDPVVRRRLCRLEPGQDRRRFRKRRLLQLLFRFDNPDSSFTTRALDFFVELDAAF